jgi:hypothetical protein
VACGAVHQLPTNHAESTRSAAMGPSQTCAMSLKKLLIRPRMASVAPIIVTPQIRLYPTRDGEQYVVVSAWHSGNSFRFRHSICMRARSSARCAGSSPSRECTMRPTCGAPISTSTTNRLHTTCLKLFSPDSNARGNGVPGIDQQRGISGGRPPPRRTSALPCQHRAAAGTGRSHLNCLRISASMAIVGM